MSWRDIIKAETLESVAKDMEALFRGTDWRTFMQDKLVDLHERIEGMSIEEIEDLRNLKYHLFSPKMQEYEGMVDKLLQLKGSD